VSAYQLGGVNLPLALNKALYGLKQLLIIWYNHLANNFEKEGFYLIFADQAVFKNDTNLGPVSYFLGMEITRDRKNC